MILLDADIVLIDRRYKTDPRYPVNRQVIERIQTLQIPAGITSQALLEVVGIMSFNIPTKLVPTLADDLASSYSLKVVPEFLQHPDYAGCSIQELIDRMSLQMSLGDAVQAVQIAHFARSANCLLTWNAGHFIGKIAIPVLTPQEWLLGQAGPTP